MGPAEHVPHQPEHPTGLRDVGSASNRLWSASPAFLAIFTLGMLVYFVGGYWAGPSYGVRSVVKVALPLLLFLAVIGCRRVEVLQEWYGLAVGFLAAACGFLASWVVSDPLLRATGLSTDSVPGLAMAKFFDALPIVVVGFLVARAGGLTTEDLFLRKGRVREWLIVGLVALIGFLVLFVLQASDQGIGADRLLALAPWTAVFVFSNAWMEEFHFRGLLLRSSARLLGPPAANICIALFFTLVHAPVQYTPDIVSFLAVVFVLALVWGYIIQRTQALWGAVLFHAGADLLIMIGVYQTYGAA